MFNTRLTPARLDSIRRVPAGPASPTSALFSKKFGWTGRTRLAIVPRAPARRLSLKKAALDDAGLDQGISPALVHLVRNGANFNTRVIHAPARHNSSATTNSATPITGKPGIDPALGFERRWVIYNGVSEASMTSPARLERLAASYGRNTPPTAEDYKAHPWELPHMGNPTGTPAADPAGRFNAPPGAAPAHRRRL